jgi:hypothetical protein
MSLLEFPRGPFDIQVVTSGAADEGAQPPASRLFPPHSDTARRTRVLPPYILYPTLMMCTASLDVRELSEQVHALNPGPAGKEAAKLIQESKICGKIFMNLSEDELGV